MITLNPTVYPPAKINAIIHLITSNLTIEFVLITIFLWAIKGKPKFIGPLAIGIITLDLFLFATGNIFTAPVSTFQLQAPPINLGVSRYLSISDALDYLGPHVYWNHLRVRSPFAPDLSNQELENFLALKHEISLMPGNINMFYSWSNVSGYSAVVLNSYANYWQSQRINSVTINNLDDPRLSQMGVNFIVTDTIRPYPALTTGFKIISTNPLIYQRLQPTPRAWFESGRGKVTITNYKPELVDISTNNPSSDSLVLSDSFYPGWQATIDGQLVIINAYQHAFRSIAVPAGSHQIRFSYHSQSATIGATLSLIFALILLILISCQNHKSLSLFLTGMGSKIPKSV